MLDKRLTLGGLQVGGPKTIQNPARFRVANNFYQTRDDVYVPRFGNVPYLTFGLSEVVIATHSFKDKPFIITSANGVLSFYYDSASKLPCPKSVPTLPLVGEESLTNGITFIEYQGCLYFNIPKLGLYKFDTEVVYRAGVPMPYLQFMEGGNASPNGCYVRAIAYRIDPTGNIVMSGYTQTRGVNITAGSYKVSFGENNETYTTPTSRDVYDDFTQGANDFYAIGTIGTAASPTELNFLASEHNLVVGCRVFLCFISTSSSNATTYYGSFRVASIAGNNIVFSTADIKPYDHSTGGWGEPESRPASEIRDFYLGGKTIATNTLLSLWTSTAETGSYAWKADTMGLPKNVEAITFNVSFTGAIDTPEKLKPNSPFNGLLMGDIYDVTTIKQPFPCLMDDLDSRGMGHYDDNLYVAMENEVYYSDVSLGGNFEMTNKLSFIVVGSPVDGENVSVCGNDSFLTVSRRNKTFCIQGNIPTANYQVRSADTGSVGAYTPEAVVSLEGILLLANKAGIWGLKEGGSSDELSKTIRVMFDDFSNTKVIEEEMKWNLNDYPMFPDAETNQFLRTTYDRARNLVVFYNNSGQCLVLNLNNGEFTTWSGITEEKLQSLTFILDKYFVGAKNVLYVEDKTSVNKYDYADSPTLVTTWLTAGEPSLEKKSLQLKMWGLVDADVTVSQQKDWTEAVISNSVYNGNEGYSHKKRLDSANALAISISMQFKNINRVEVEGLEIEFSPIQVGMKR